MTDVLRAAVADLRVAERQVWEQRRWLGAAIRAERERRGLTQRRFALSIGADPANYSKMERGLGAFESLSMRALAELGVGS